MSTASSLSLDQPAPPDACCTSSAACCRIASVNSTAGWVELDRALPFSAQPGCTLHRYAPTLTQGGIERLTIEFSK